MKSIFTLYVLFVAQAAAKIGFGPCPNLSFMTLAQYNSALTFNGAAAVYSHKVLFGDKGLEDLLGFAKAFFPQLPNFKCGDLFP